MHANEYHTQPVLLNAGRYQEKLQMIDVINCGSAPIKLRNTCGRVRVINYDGVRRSVLENVVAKFGTV